MDDLTGDPSAAGAVKAPRRDRVGTWSVSWLAWGLWLLVVLVNALVAVLLLRGDAMSGEQWIEAWVTTAPFLAFATVGAVILARRPGNRIGWLCWAIGLAVSLSFFGSKQMWAILAANQDRSSAWVPLPMLGTMAWLGTLLGLLPFLILLFPTGRLLSSRWRPVAWATGLVVGLYLTARLLTPGPVDRGLPDNPLGVEPAQGLLQLAQTIAGIAAPLLALAVLTSLVLRFRRARGEERQQLKWLTYGTAIFVLVIPTLGPVFERVPSPFVGPVFFALAISIIPIAIGVAVLKYRLYDIDRVINRTLVYGLLTVLLGAVYTAACSASAGSSTLSPESLLWPWLPPPLGSPPCSSLPAAASRRWWIGGSTAAATMRPGPSRHSALGSATRWTWTPWRLSCLRWSTRRCSRPDHRCGFVHRPKQRQAA